MKLFNLTTADGKKIECWSRTVSRRRGYGSVSVRCKIFIHGKLGDSIPCESAELKPTHARVMAAALIRWAGGRLSR